VAKFVSGLGELKARIRHGLFWLGDLSLSARLWFWDRVAGPLPETEDDRARRRSTIPIMVRRRAKWFRRR
jgi:hypothetical protein